MFGHGKKRNLGDEKRNVHARKGLPGDWKNHFTKKHVAKFKRLFGDVLVTLGYEKDQDWEV
jgi:hypothetical protein